MKDIAELKRRVEDAGDHFGRMAEQQRAGDQRVARLLEQVETELARNRAEIERLGGALSGAEEESGQLRGLLNSLLDAAEANGPGVEAGGGKSGGDTVSDFEARIGALLPEREAARSDAAYYLGADGDDDGDGDGDGDTATAESSVDGLTGFEANEGPDPRPEDLGAVNRIIQRISLLTGDFVDRTGSGLVSGPGSGPSSGAVMKTPALKAG